jgi:hypothetical protein
MVLDLCKHFIPFLSAHKTLQGIFGKEESIKFAVLGSMFLYA